MQFDSNNKVVQLCAAGMQMEGEGKNVEAHQLFEEAWHMASNDIERFVAAHYLARNQKDPKNNLKWNLEALEYANRTGGKDMDNVYPSLYLNIARSYETMGNIDSAIEHYYKAQQYATHLASDGYGNMIRSGIREGLRRVQLS